MTQHRKGEPCMNLPPLPNLRVKVFTEKNPWEDSASLPVMPTGGALILSFVCLISAVYPALMVSYADLWWLPLAILSIFYLRINRTPYGWLLLAAAFLGGAMIGGLATGAALICLISTVVITSLLHTTTRHPLLICLPVAAYAAACLITGNPLTALLSLPAFPAAYVLGRSIMKNEGRVASISACALMLGTVFVLFAALAWRNSGMEMSMDALAAYFNALHDEILNTALTDPDFKAVLSMLDTTQAPLADLLSETLTLMLLLTPGLITVLMLAIAYIAQYLCVTSYGALGMKQLCTLVSRRFIMSVLSAIIFILCAITALFPAKGVTMFAAVTSNLWLILFPGMLIVGFWSLYASWRARPAPLMLVIALVAAALMPPIFLIFVALTGAATTLTRPLLLRMAALMQEQNGTGGDSGSDSDNSTP